MTSLSASSKQQAAVRVDFEYGPLREVIVGRPEGFRLPELSLAALAEYTRMLLKDDGWPNWCANDEFRAAHDTVLKAARD
jgi:hypothetical protein